MEVEPARTEAIVESTLGWQRPGLPLRRLRGGEEQRATLTRARQEARMFFYVRIDKWKAETYYSLGELIEAGWRVAEQQEGLRR